MTKIGILREGKVPHDKRVAFTPEQCAFIINNFKNVKLVVQPSDWRSYTNDEFIKKGYAFLAIGYFGAKGMPQTLDRISINQVHNAILEATKNPKINKKKINLFIIALFKWYGGYKIHFLHPFF